MKHNDVKKNIKLTLNFNIFYAFTQNKHKKYVKCVLRVNV